MKIIEIQIYGYGKFENVRLTNLQEHQVFYGENEAGKSTIMSFIHSILFGFPTKQQSELRYEPKKGTKYGGQLTVLFPDKGKVIIERVKGKATGDVAVLFEDGEIGEESQLKELLSSVDKHLYQSIFSFNLHGLQNVHQLKGEDLGRFLFSTGTIGSDRVLKAENELLKELDSRFKPNGKNPQLNGKIKELYQLQKELKKAEQLNLAYTRILKEKGDIELKLAEQKEIQAELTRRIHITEEWKKVAPLIRQESILQEELTRFSDFQFPDNGLDQLERLKELQQPLQRKIELLQQQRNTLEKQLKELEPNLEVIEKGGEIEQAVDGLPLLEKWKQEVVQDEIKLRQLEDDISFYREKLHLPLSSEQILSSNTSVFMEEKAQEVQRRQKRLSDKKYELDEQFQDETKRLEDLEKSISTLQQEILSEQERQKLEEQLGNVETASTLFEKKEQIVNRIKLLTNLLNKEKQQNRQRQFQSLFFACLFLLMVVWGFYADLFLFAIVGGGGLLYSLYTLFKNGDTNYQLLQDELENLQRESNKLEQKRQNGDLSDHVEFLQRQINRDNLLREQFLHQSVRLDRQQEQYDRVIDAYEEWEKEIAIVRKEWLSLGKELNIPSKIAEKHIYDAFQIIVKLKALIKDQSYIKEQLLAKKKALQEKKDILQKLISQFISEEDSVSLTTDASLLRKKLKAEQGKQIQYKEKFEQFQRIDAEWDEYRFQLTQIKEEMASLFNIAAVEDEEQFRIKAKKADKQKELLEKIDQLSLQIKLSSLEESDWKGLPTEEKKIEAKIQSFKVTMADCEKEISRLHDILADLKYQIQMIEDGGTYAEILHRFRQKRDEFNQDAKEWARLALAREILIKTVSQYKQERLPRMLKKAEEYLQYLTGGNYIRILPKQEGNGFLIERKDHLLFEANELSQATTEQIYVALRFSLAVIVYEKYNFPIIIDDSFVNFDSVRNERVIQLLKELKGKQVLFFTCHEHLLKYFNSDEILNLNTFTPSEGRAIV
jgi:uncharacterized protein YhaN